MFDIGIPESAVETARRVLESLEGTLGGKQGRTGEHDRVDVKPVGEEKLG